MKKLFFFKSSTSGNGTDKQLLHRQKDDHVEQNTNSPKGLIKSKSEEVSNAAALRRSRSFSSAAFLIEATSSNDATRNNHHRRLQNHSSRCFTPERQNKKAESSRLYQVQHDSSGSLSSCSSIVSSQVLDRYIDGEEHLERSKQQKSGSSHSSSKGRRLPPRAQSPSLLSDNGKEKRRSNGLRDASARSLARNVIERLSHTHGNSKALSYEPIRVQDVCGAGGYNGKTLDSNSDVLANVLVPLTEHYETVNEYYVDDDQAEQHQQFFLHGNKDVYMGTNDVCKEGDVSSELERRYKEAEKRVKLLSLEERKFVSDRDFDISSLVGDIGQMEEERVGLAFEVLSLLRSQMDERASAREDIRRVKKDWDLHVKRLEKEKSELQTELEKEFDKRSSEWTLKMENFKLEEKRLRERVRELAEHNVSLQREISTFHEKETERIDMMRHLNETVTELSATSEEMREENLYLMQNLTKLQESYSGTNDDLDCVRRKFEEKDMECKELHKSVTRFLRTCKEQEKTIEGLRDGLSEEIKKQPSDKDEHVDKKLQMEQLRLVGVELSLRKEIESMKLAAESLRRENICLLNRVKGNGEEANTLTFKLDNEMKIRVCNLQDQGVSMLNESTQLCYKFLKFIKENLVNNGLSEQFLMESEMRVHGIRRGAESLKRSLQIVKTVLVEKSNEMASNTKSSSSSANRSSSHSVEESLRAELKAETLITSLLREKMYFMEEEIEQLQAEVAAGVRGNEVLQREIRKSLDNLSINSHQLKDHKLQMVKKEENVNRLETNLQETVKELASMKVTLPKVLEERDQMLKEVSECRERNMDLESEKEMLKKKIEKLEEDTLFKEGQITILKDTLGSKRFDLLSSPEFSYDDFLVK